MPQLLCQGRHTLYQPADEEWHCPHCGAGPEYFYIDFTNYPDCDLLHVGDTVICCSKICISTNGECRAWTGKKLASVMQKNTNLVKCPYCNGRGYVARDTLLNGCVPGDFDV